MAGHAKINYKKIYFMLLILFAVSVAGPEVADLMGLEGATRLILVLSTAFGIALVKAYYVLAYFMHLKFEKIYAPYILWACLALLVVFFFGTAIDVMKPDGRNWEKTFVYEAPADDGHHGGHGDEHEVDSHAEESPDAHH